MVLDAKVTVNMAEQMQPGLFSVYQLPQGPAPHMVTIHRIQKEYPRQDHALSGWCFHPSAFQVA
jgi:hypothetical protein